MKNIALIMLLIAFQSSFSQFIKPAEINTTNISVVFDPRASVKENGLNIGIEINYTQKYLYVHTGIQTFSVLEGGYIDWTTAAGYAMKLGYFDNYKAYVGGRLGFILRERYRYPTAGFEIGLDHSFEKCVIIGIRSTYDLRGDFRYFNAPSDWRFSTFVKVGVIIQ